MTSNLSLTCNRSWWVWHTTPGLTCRHWLTWHRLGISPQKSLAWSWPEAQEHGVPDEMYHYWQSDHYPKIKRMSAWLASASDHHIVPFCSSDYPPLLRFINDPPLLLYVIGRLSALNMPQCAVVGSRKPTGPALKAVPHIAHTLVECSFSVASGLAIGVDGAAHHAALDLGGTTVAVIGCGIDSIYPKTHQPLANKIRCRGALVSEMPLGTAVAPWQFPHRNRIITGMSVGTVVVEAALKSGSLISGRLTLEQNRELIVMPSSVFNLQARGGLKLIQEGAYCLSSLEDLPLILNASPLIRPTKKNKESTDLTQEEQTLLNHIGYENTSVESLLNELKWPLSTINQMITRLEAKHQLLRTPYGVICY